MPVVADDPWAVSETAKYTRIWQVPAYRRKCHSLDLWRQRRDLFPATFASGIDLGCGLGRLVPEWLNTGIDAYGVDLVPAQSLEPEIYAAYRERVFEATLWNFDPVRTFDVGVCTDVMEHLPEQHVPAALRGMATYCTHVVFKIANFQSRSLGEELHLTRHDAAWWEQQLRDAMGGTVRRVSYRTHKQEYVLTWTRLT